MKLVKRIAAVLLCLAMFCSLAACSLEDPDNKNIVGTWCSEPVNFGDMLNETMAGSDKEMAQYYDFSDVSLSFTYEFKEDKTYSTYVDEADKTAFDDAVSAAISKGAEAQFGTIGADVNMTADEVLEASGYGSIADFTKYLMEDLNAEAIAAEIETSGNWLVTGGKLISTDSTEQSVADAGTYVLYKLDGDTLTFDVPEDYAGDDAFFYPLEFTRQ